MKPDNVLTTTFFKLFQREVIKVVNTMNKIGRGKPRGCHHPMSMGEFMALFWQQVQDGPDVKRRHRLAYAGAEQIVTQRFGRRKFRGYESFKVAKSRFCKNKFFKKYTKITMQIRHHLF